jgi:phosphoribosylformylglycinamidine cyclo-ligase
MMSEDRPAMSYSAAGVDISAGERAVDLMRASVSRATRPEVVGGLGGFAGLFRPNLSAFADPLLATSTDGVGTKVAIAQMMGIYDTIGLDLVGMVVDDLVVCGAEPLFLTDYISCGRVIPERIAAIVRGVAEGCVQAGCALSGGETAEHPGLLGPDEFDLAGAATGVVDAIRLLGPNRVRSGDAVIALASSGLHSNGYSLVRHVFFDHAGWSVERPVPELGSALGEALLTPTRIYARACLEVASRRDVHAYTHITGGGLAANLARVLPPGYAATLDRATWTPGTIFQLVGQVGRVETPELESTLNMGVGFAAVVAASDADTVVADFRNRGIDSWIAGSVQGKPGNQPAVVDLTGTHK